MQFLTFPKITAQRLDTTGHGLWVATEKIHGAQLVLGTDGRQVAVGKRKEWLQPDSPFFGWQLLRSHFHRAANAVYAALGGGGQVWIYGELFGGRYPHPDVPQVPGLVPVQTGIWYSPNLEYAAFDIVHAAPGNEPIFLSYAKTAEPAQLAGLRIVPPLGQGRFAELD